MQDEWSCFGDDSDNEVEIEEGAAHVGTISIAHRITTYVISKLLMSNSMVSLSNRHVMLISNPNIDDKNVHEAFVMLEQSFKARGVLLHVMNCSLHTSSTMSEVDCAIFVSDTSAIADSLMCMIRNAVVPGGFVALYLNNKLRIPKVFEVFTDPLWKCNEQDVYMETIENICFISIDKRSGLMNSLGCAWKCRTMTSHYHELDLIDKITIGRSVHERLQTCMTESSLNEISIENCVKKLLEYGVVIIRDLFCSEDIHPWGGAALKDLDDAIAELERRNIDLLNPGVSTNDPLSYHELAMREDLRLDLRNGRAFKQMRENKNAQNIRLHPGIAKIVKCAFNPKGEFFRGNYGRFNFEGSGPDGTPTPLKVGEVGAVISLPGAADQAIHADTPHLFEHIDLPPHYANLFIPAVDGRNENNDKEEFKGDTLLGGTAFIVGTHKLEKCGHLMNEKNRNERDMFTIRPSLCVGDALIFDCRILHFGMANMSKTSQRRPLLYINLTHTWFVDPKNWEDRERLFPDVDTIKTGGGIVNN